VTKLVEAMCYQPEGRGFDSLSLELFSMALGSTQPLRDMSTRNISCVVKDGRCLGLTTVSPSFADWKSWSLYLLEPSGPVQAVTGIAL
jgi:hypothetical protein